MPGRTAYFGLLQVGKPKTGETVVVSAASGAVGSAVGQIAKIQGCRAVGIAGGPEKCRYVVEELGFDACVDYKAGNLDEDLAKACPDGIDVYFENVGGAVLRAVAPLLNAGARVPICGFISAYNSEDITQEETPFHVLGALPNPPEHRFFIVYEFMKDYEAGNRQLSQWLADGALQHRECVAEGIENAPEAFRGLLRGKNFGKQLVKLGA
jgi:NADPH-dependent curcumin reductase CurA